MTAKPKVYPASRSKETLFAGYLRSYSGKLEKVEEKVMKIYGILKSSKEKEPWNKLSLLYLFFFQMMPFINEAVDTFLQKLDNISKTGEIVDLHRLV